MERKEGRETVRRGRKERKQRKRKMGGEKGRGKEEERKENRIKNNNNKLKVVIMNQDWQFIDIQKLIPYSAFISFPLMSLFCPTVSLKLFHYIYSYVSLSIPHDWDVFSDFPCSWSHWYFQGLLDSFFFFLVFHLGFVYNHVLINQDYTGIMCFLRERSQRSFSSYIKGRYN